MKFPEDNRDKQSDAGLAVACVVLLVAAIIVWGIYFLVRWGAP